jgi:two-component system, OmpR family, sensor histidine kinase KdpD
MQTFVNQTALALERTILAEKSEQAQLQIETERLRNSLLSSVSHDLRTPLAAITGAVTSLLENDAILKDDERRDLTGLALDAAQRLNRLITNILEVTRLESGGVHVNKEWQMIEEVVGTVLHQLDDRLVGRSVAVRIPHDLPPVPMDAVLIGQVLINLLENALKYTPPGSPLEVAAHAGTGEVMIEVADRGAGLPPGADQHIFEKFYRAQPAESVGVGLGLTICRGIIEAHGGRIWAENRPNGGSVFRFTLPLNNVPVLLDE